jgi:dTDP-4-dehydrorhamnose reductase
MKIILLGANGMLGSMLRFVATQPAYNQCSLIALDRTKFNAANDSVDSIGKYITEDTDTVIVNCIGAIPQKKPTAEDYRRLNFKFPQHLASFCASRSIPLIHVSTNCVFSGKTPYCTEDDVPDAEDAYGQSKADGEPASAIVLRCSIIGFETAGGHYGLLEWYVGSKGEVRGYTDSYWNGLTTFELSKTIMDIIHRKAFSPRLEHHYAINTLSKYELLREMQQYLVEPATLIPVANGIQHYTLASKYTHTQHPSLEQQLNELFAIQDDYRAFTK